MKHGSGAVRRSTPAARPTVADGTAPQRRRTVRLAATAGLGLVGALLALSLSGCGIRDTAVPVDAGEPASRTACPPLPDATLSQLEADSGMLPSPAAPTPTVDPSDSGALLSQATASAIPQLSPSPTEADGSLSCLHPGATPSGSADGTAGGADGSTSGPTSGPTGSAARSSASDSARGSNASDAPDDTKDSSGAATP